MPFLPILWQIVTDIVLFVIRLFTGKFGESDDEKLLKEDIELANAIKNGDEITVARIRERRKHYGKILSILILKVIIFCIISRRIYRLY